ncbi:hypothetical protein AB0E08_08490 [Streptomyces sp. NPDC048281]
MTKHKNTSNSLAGRARALAEKTGIWRIVSGGQVPAGYLRRA